MLKSEEISEELTKVINDENYYPYPYVSVLDVVNAINNHFTFYFDSIKEPMNSNIKELFFERYKEYCSEHDIKRYPKYDIVKIIINNNGISQYMVISLKEKLPMGFAKNQIDLCYIYNMVNNQTELFNLEGRTDKINCHITNYIDACKPLINGLLSYNKEYINLLKSNNNSTNNSTNNICKFKAYNIVLYFDKNKVKAGITPNLDAYSIDEYVRDTSNQNSPFNLVLDNENKILSKSFISVEDLPANIQKYYDDYDIESITKLVLSKRKRR